MDLKDLFVCPVCGGRVSTPSVYQGRTYTKHTSYEGFWDRRFFTDGMCFKCMRGVRIYLTKEQAEEYERQQTAKYARIIRPETP